MSGFSLAVTLVLFVEILLMPLALHSVIAMPSGPTWRSWGGTAEDVSYGIGTDTLGNIYLTGSTRSFGSGSPATPNLAVLKFDPSGLLVWQKVWNIGGGSVGRGISIDSSGGIYVTGYTINSGSQGLGVVLLKLNSTGMLQWQTTWGGNATDQGYGIAVDSFGGIFVVGTTNSTGQGLNDILLLKFNSTGSMLWGRTWGGNGNEEGHGVAVDTSGNAYVTGFTTGFGAGGSDVILLKYGATGSLSWQETWGGPGFEAGLGIAVDTSNNIYVTGTMGATVPYPSFSGGDALLLKFNSGGTLLWQRSWGGPHTEIGYGVAVNSSGVAYVTGVTASSPSNAFLIETNSGGGLLWEKNWGSSSNAAAYAASVDSAGEVVVAGSINAAAALTPSSGNLKLDNPSFTPSTSTGITSALSQPIATPLGTLTSASGSQTYQGGSESLLGLFPNVPLYMVAFSTSQNSIFAQYLFSNHHYATGETDNFTAGTYTASVIQFPPTCPPNCYTFTGWSTTGAVFPAAPSAQTTTVTITGSGTFQAIFAYNPPTSLSPTAILFTVTIAIIGPTSRLRRRLCRKVS